MFSRRISCLEGSRTSALDRSEDSESRKLHYGERQHLCVHGRELHGIPCVGGAAVAVIGAAAGGLRVLQGELMPLTKELLRFCAKAPGCLENDRRKLHLLDERAVLSDLPLVVPLLLLGEWHM